jgi:hypothetical protein
LFDYLDFNCSQCVPNMYTWQDAADLMCEVAVWIVGKE